MSGFDLVAVVEALRSTIKAGIPDLADVYAYPPHSPQFPAVGIFIRRVTYHETVRMSLGDVDFEIRSAAMFDAEDSLRLLYGFLSAGTGFPSSLVDVLEASPTLGGVVENCVVNEASIESVGNENVSMHVATVTGVIRIRKV